MTEAARIASLQVAKELTLAAFPSLDLRDAGREGEAQTEFVAEQISILFEKFYESAQNAMAKR